LTAWQEAVNSQRQSGVEGDMAEAQAEIEEHRLGPVETIRRIMEIFSRTEIALDGPNAELAADQMISNQTPTHKIVLSIAFTNLKDRRSRWISSYHNEFDNFIDRLSAGNRYNRSVKPNAARVYSDVTPVLRNDDAITLTDIWKFSSLTESDKAEITIACYLRATRTVMIDNRPQPLPDLGKRLDFAIARIEAVWIADNASSETASGINNAAEEMIVAARDKYAATAVAIEENFETIRRQNIKLDEQTKLMLQKTAELDSLVRNSTDQVGELRKEFVANYDSTEAAAQAFMESVRSEANFEGLKIHWNGRARSAAWSFGLSGLLIGTLLVAFPSYLIWNSDQIITFMRHLADVATVDVGPNPSAATLTVATISRLLIVTIPVALYFWAIKLVVRFNMRSMMLMDDARQRSTMLETYYRMIEKSAATREDRALVLQALMRPAPGHGPDTVEPPSFTEVIDKAIGRQGS
jgi:hypothetical protein